MRLNSKQGKDELPVLPNNISIQELSWLAAHSQTTLFILDITIITEHQNGKSKMESKTLFGFTWEEKIHKVLFKS